ITTFLSDAVDVGDVVDRSVKLLSQLTRQVAVVQYPSLRESKVRRVELVRVGQEHALVVVVSTDAHVEQTTIALGAGVTDEAFEAVARDINVVADGLGGSALEDALDSWLIRPDQAPWAVALRDAVVSATRG